MPFGRRLPEGKCGGKSGQLHTGYARCDAVRAPPPFTHPTPARERVPFKPFTASTQYHNALLAPAMSAYTMDGVAELKDLVLEDLQHAASLFQVALEKRELPDSIPDRVIYSTLGTLLLCQTIVVLLLPKGRKLIWDVFETVVATVLALLLVLVILGLPIGGCHPRLGRCAPMAPGVGRRRALCTHAPTPSSPQKRACASIQLQGRCTSGLRVPCSWCHHCCR